VAAYSAEPWAGLTKVHTRGIGGGQTDTYVTVSVEDVVPSTVTGARSSTYWDFSAGVSVTLRLEVEKVVVGAGGPAPTNYKVSVRAPGVGSNIGASSPSSNTSALPSSGSANSITLRFDDNPLDANTGTATFGMLEIFLELYSDATTKAADSRGDNSAVYSLVEWARGYVRAGGYLIDTAVSNIAIAGNDPQRFYVNDPLYLRMATNPPYRQASGVLKVRNIYSATPIIRTSGTLNSTTGNWDASFTGAGGMVDTWFLWAVHDLRLDLSSTDPWSNGDAEFIWAASGQPNQAEVVSGTSNLALAARGRLNVDPNQIGFTTNTSPTAIVGGTQ
jgi:hypothetical protein